MKNILFKINRIKTKLILLFFINLTFKPLYNAAAAASSMASKIKTLQRVFDKPTPALPDPESIEIIKLFSQQKKINPKESSLSLWKRIIPQHINEQDWIRHFAITSANILTEKVNLEILYFNLWSLAGLKGFSFVHTNYPDLIAILQEGLPQFDPSFNTPLTEFGTFNESKIFNPINPNHTTLILGALPTANSYAHPEKLYRVNIAYGEALPESKTASYKKEGHSLDMLADMNNKEQMSSLPDNQFDTIFVEQVHTDLFHCPAFFQTAARILKSNGELIFSCPQEYLRGKPYNFGKDQWESYYLKNGFRIKNVMKDWKGPDIYTPEVTASKCLPYCYIILTKLPPINPQSAFSATAMSTTSVAVTKPKVTGGKALLPPASLEELKERLKK